MQTIGLQRTLLIGLGKTGAQTTDRLLTELKTRLGDTGFVRGVAIITSETPLSQLQTPVIVSGEPVAETWQIEWQQQLEQALREILQLENLTRLGQGVGLRHADEVHTLIIANPAESRLLEVLPHIIDTVRHTVNKSLACHASLTGVWLFAPAETGDPALAEESDQVSDAVEAAADGWLRPDWPLQEFDRGCFVAGPTNEVGLIIGKTATLVERTVTFLTLLIRETGAAKLAWENDVPAGWGVPLTSFGLTTLRWPGQELAGALGARWSKALLMQPIKSPTQTEGLAEKARVAAQQLMSTLKLAPPLLIEQLINLMPGLPNHLTALVPEVPWPWLLINMETDLDQAGQRWQDSWLSADDRLQDTLKKLEIAWPHHAETWLKQQLHAGHTGAVMLTHCYLAAVSELLHVYIEGVEHQLDETQQDLADADERRRALAGQLAAEMETWPDSPLMTLLTWGWHPLRWPRYWARCRYVQTKARNLAHLTRARLLVWQAISFYEEALPFYRRLLKAWEQIVKKWEEHCRRVAEAGQSSALGGWAAQLSKIVTESAGPWSDDLINQLYQEVVNEHADALDEQIGTFVDWYAEDLTAEALAQRVQKAVTPVLMSQVALPVDHALCRRFPTEATRAGWLEEVLEQARPFWRFDETRLAETTRAQVHRETWLLLPDAEASPLAHLGQTWSRPPRLVSTHNPEEFGVVTLRRWVNVPDPEIDTEMNEKYP